MRISPISFLGALLLSAAFALAANPTPFVNQPLIPASIAPGGPDFTLTVNGTGFVSGSTVNWNGSPRTTTFVNASQLTATILAIDIATANTGSVTVTSPGAGTSNVVFMPVRQPASFVSMNSNSFGTQLSSYALVVADFNHDGIEDMAVSLYQSNPNLYEISILLGNGDGTFRQRVQYTVNRNPTFLLAADVNGDGKLDLLAAGSADGQNNYGLGVLLGHGDGTFQPLVLYKGTTCCADALGDFNRDGAIDVAEISSNILCIYPGNGDGSFQPQICTNLPDNFYYEAIGDFNSDGKLDVAVSGFDSNSHYLIGLLLGNGDGTFQVGETYHIEGYDGGVAAADFNADGRLDLAVADVSNRVTVFLGNGDGTLQSPLSFPTAYQPIFVTTADMNGDGQIDLLVGGVGLGVASISVLLGNGTGTFQNYSDYYGSSIASLGFGDFNGDGRLDAAVANNALDTVTILTQDDGTAVSLSKYTLSFPTQLVNTVSDPRLITLTNNGTAPIKISKIRTTANFSQLSNCRTVQPGGSCKIGVFFTPTSPGDITGYMTIVDDAGGSPQIVNLSGTATVVSFSPSNLDFGDVQVGKISPPQNVLLTNQGNSSLTINEVGIGGQNSKDFLQVNACPNKLPAGASCTITVYFHPSEQGSRSAILGVKDSGGGSPQKVNLFGTGTGGSLFPSKLDSGDEQLGTISPPQNVSLTIDDPYALLPCNSPRSPDTSLLRFWVSRAAAAARRKCR